VARVERRELPAHALTAGYLRKGAYADCYVTTIDRPITHAEFVTAFYTTWLFKLERLILARFVQKPSTDEEAVALARDERQTFAAWCVEARATNQLLMCDFLGHTRSWLMVEADGAGTRLFFGSVVTSDDEPGARGARRTHRPFMGFHQLYSHALLACARSRLTRAR
jgi:hypothetical protein